MRYSRRRVGMSGHGPDTTRVRYTQTTGGINNSVHLGGAVVDLGQSRTHAPSIPMCAQSFSAPHAHMLRTHTHPQRREKAFLHEHRPLL